MERRAEALREALPGAVMTAAYLIDNARYPLTELSGADGQALVRDCRARLARDGACVLEDFVLPEVVAAVRDELVPLLGQAYYCEKQHNPYLTANDLDLPDDHPRNRLQTSDVGALADDQIPATSLLRRLYLWDRLQAFVAALLEVPQLYPYADPLGSLNLNIFQTGQQLAWHYDNADWVVTLMLQPAEAGGVYEYVPWSRSAEDENFAAIGRVLDGDAAGVRRLSMGEGALVLFRGRRSLHRVTPVEGGRPRLVAVLSYDTEPGVMLTDFNRKLFYGRAN